MNISLNAICSSSLLELSKQCYFMIMMILNGDETVILFYFYFHLSFRNWSPNAVDLDDNGGSFGEFISRRLFVFGMCAIQVDGWIFNWRRSACV